MINKTSHSIAKYLTQVKVATCYRKCSVFSISSELNCQSFAIMTIIHLSLHFISHAICEPSRVSTTLQQSRQNYFFSLHCMYSAMPCQIWMDFVSCNWNFCKSYHIKAETKWLPLCRSHFQIFFVIFLVSLKCPWSFFPRAQTITIHNWFRWSHGFLVLARWQTISKPMVIKFTDAYVRHSTAIRYVLHQDYKQHH